MAGNIINILADELIDSLTYQLLLVLALVPPFNVMFVSQRIVGLFSMAILEFTSYEI